MNARGRPRVLPDEAVRRMFDTLHMSVSQIAKAFNNTPGAVRVSLKRTSDRPPVPAWALREALQGVVSAYDKNDVSALGCAVRSAIKLLEGSGQ